MHLETKAESLCLDNKDYYLLKNPVSLLVGGFFIYYCCMNNKIGILLLSIALILGSCSSKKKLVKITTTKGEMIVYLYDETPQHQANFLKLARQGFYDSTTFHRVMQYFMIQGGDPLTRVDSTRHLGGTGGPGYTIPAEFRDNKFHKKGALAAARQPDQVNPDKESSGSQFYIVQGKIYTSYELSQMEKQLQQRRNDTSFHFSAAQIAAYTTQGGTPFLDEEYTVFGEVIQGIDVIDSLAAVPTNKANNRPLKDEFMKVEVISMSAKSIWDKYGWKLPQPDTTIILEDQ